MNLYGKGERGRQREKEKADREGKGHKERCRGRKKERNIGEKNRDINILHPASRGQLGSYLIEK